MKFKFPLKPIIVIINVLVALWIGIVSVDYYRAKHQQDPLFSIRTVGVPDGGILIKYGIGYKVIHYNSTETDIVRTDIVFKFGW